MKVFNTLTRKKEEFIPIKEGEYKIYVCGPTVYNYIHIGNARPAVIFDTLRRYLEYRGNTVRYVSNITDIDDKIIKKANEEGVSFDTIARKYEGEYYTDLDGMNVKPADARPR
ncbi:MAG: class I tRNA ligase family protein, partial [Oscillospiraceae bacterium]